MAAKSFVFVFSGIFLILCFAKFSSNFAKFKIILSKFRVLRNFDNAVLQPPYGGVE